MRTRYICTPVERSGVRECVCFPFPPPGSEREREKDQSINIHTDETRDSKESLLLDPAVLRTHKSRVNDFWRAGHNAVDPRLFQVY